MRKCCGPGGWEESGADQGETGSIVAIETFVTDAVRCFLSPLFKWGGSDMCSAHTLESRAGWMFNRSSQRDFQLLHSGPVGLCENPGKIRRSFSQIICKKKSATEISKELDLSVAYLCYLKQQLSEASSSFFQDSPSSHWVDHSLEKKNLYFSFSSLAFNPGRGQILLIALNFYLHFLCFSVPPLTLTFLQKKEEHIPNISSAQRNYFLANYL